MQTPSGRTRQRWFERCYETVLQREVVTAAVLRRFDALVRTARMVIVGTCSELVISRLAEEGSGSIAGQ